MRDQLYSIIDYETYSEADLKKVGAYEYSRHPTTEVICVGYSTGTLDTIGDAPTNWWSPLTDGLVGNFADFYQAIMNPDIILVAHNALFDRLITMNVFTKEMRSKLKEIQAIPTHRWLCTASMCSALGLPRGLEGAAAALKLEAQKDMSGNRLMKKWMKPKKPSKKDPSVRHTDLKELMRIIDYCVKDIDTTKELFLRIPHLSPAEREVWIMDQEINLRGFCVDRPLVHSVLGMIAEETKVLDAEVRELTLGVLDSANQRDGVLDWLETENVHLPNMQAKTIADTLASGLVTGDSKRMLEIRQAVSKTSTAKYESLRAWSEFDGRVHGCFVYHGPSTGRWAGSGPQPQNLPRGVIKEALQAADIVAEGDVELIRLLYGEPMTVFSSCLRNMIVAPPGKKLHAADYAQIEVRVLFWMAGDEPGLEAFRNKEDIYKKQAADIFNILVSMVDDGQRFIGKETILGCGFSMGPPKFQLTQKEKWGNDISIELAEAAVNGYRNSHKPVVEMWDRLNRAAIAAVQNPGKHFTVKKTTWVMEDVFLYCVLPSGRRLAYPYPSIKYRPTPWGEKRPTLHHWGVDAKTKKWVEERTYGGLLTENVVQATARDIMVSAMKRIQKRPEWEIVLHAHDEVLAEHDPFIGGNLREFFQLMEKVPKWAAGCPVAVSGWEGVRYRK